VCKSNAFANLCCGKISKITFLLLWSSTFYATKTPMDATIAVMGSLFPLLAPSIFDDSIPHVIFLNRPRWVSG